jgi:DNA topoisomerase-3
MGKTLCQKEIPREQVEKLITEGKTDLIHRFISKKGRPFSAFLKLEKDKVSFEFEERERKPAAAKKTAARATKTPKATKSPRAKKAGAAA